MKVTIIFLSDARVCAQKVKCYVFNIQKMYAGVLFGNSAWPTLYFRNFHSVDVYLVSKKICSILVILTTLAYIKYLRLLDNNLLLENSNSKYNFFTNILSKINLRS